MSIHQDLICSGYSSGAVVEDKQVCRLAFESCKSNCFTIFTMSKAYSLVAQDVWRILVCVVC